MERGEPTTPDVTRRPAFLGLEVPARALLEGSRVKRPAEHNRRTDERAMIEATEQTGATTTSEQACLLLSENAAKRIAYLAQMEKLPKAQLRISVSGGGCSGFQYHYDFDAQVNDDDRLFTRDQAAVVIDETSLELLNGSEVDFVEDLMGAYFKIENPNAASSCGCGSSFSV